MEKEFNRAIDVLTGLLEGRVDSYEIYLSAGKGRIVEAKDGKVDAFRVSSSSGVGLRIIVDGRPGFGYSSVLAEDALKAVVETTLSGSIGATADSFLGFPSPAVRHDVSSPGALDVYDASFEAASEDELIERALDIEKNAMGFDSRVKRVRKAAYSESMSSARTVNSNGVDTSYVGTFFSGSVVAVAEENGESQMGWDALMGHKRADVDSRLIGQGAAERAVGMLGARPISTVRCPAVFENTVVMELLGALASSFLADNVQKGKSMLIGKRDKKVASAVLNLWDDGLMVGGWATAPHDCEGVPRQKTPLLSGGVCRGYLYDTYWARRGGEGSTGNASRSGFKSVPHVGTSNLYIERGDTSRDDLFKEMGRGLFIRELMGVHTVDPVSGEFSLGASGVWIEGGRPAYPVRGIAIAGTLLDLFSKVEVVGSDMRFIGSVGSPSLLFGEVNASGR